MLHRARSRPTNSNTPSTIQIWHPAHAHFRFGRRPAARFACEKNGPTSRAGFEPAIFPVKAGHPRRVSSPTTRPTGTGAFITLTTHNSLYPNLVSKHLYLLPPPTSTSPGLQALRKPPNPSTNSSCTQNIARIRPLQSVLQRLIREQNCGRQLRVFSPQRLTLCDKSCAEEPSLV